jgi:dihydrofolate reductase
MRKLSVFNSISLDGYFTDANGDMSWAHKMDPEWLAFTQENSSGGGTLVFGRKTYDMMAGWWPSPMAAAAMPEVAAHMNSLPKVVFSRTLGAAAWQNTKLIKGDLISEVRALKAQDGDAMVILGSGSIVAQLTSAGLIDEFQVVTSPVILGAGRTMFEGVSPALKLTRTRTRAFENGCIFSCYVAAK